MTIRATKIQTDKLTVGMFVQEINGRAQDSFPSCGILLEAEHQIQTLRSMCTLVTIDLTRSIDEIYHAHQQPEPSRQDESMALVTDVEIIVLDNSFSDSTARQDQLQVHQDLVENAADKYGYHGRFVYRVLEAKLIAFCDGDTVTLETLEKALADFVAYTQVNPDLMHLESQLSDQANTIIGIGLRGLIHTCVYTYSTQHNPHLEQLALSYAVFIRILHQSPKACARMMHWETFAENTMLASRIEQLVTHMEHQYQFPLTVKKTLLHICERADGQGPKKINSGRISQAAHLVKLTTLFEFLQTNAHGNTMQTASEALAHIRQNVKTAFDPTLVDSLIQVLPLFPTGQLLKVGAKQLALVVQQHPHRKLNPTLLALTSNQGDILDDAQWISSEVRLGSLQIAQTPTLQHAQLIRARLEIQMPWYKKILNPARIKQWFQSLDLTG